MDFFNSYSLSLSQIQLEKFEKLYQVFSEWNSVLNLSAIRGRDDIYKKHFIDSILLTKYISFDRKHVLDLGAGGGFPCLPLAIVSNHSSFVALDSVGKKMKAVSDMAKKLSLPVKTFHGRIEEYAHKSSFREQFDIVTARALAPWPTLLEYALPFVRVGGTFVAYQGPSALEDLKTYTHLEKKLGGAIYDVISETLVSKEDRLFVCIKKQKKSSLSYPRAIGIPKKNPIS